MSADRQGEIKISVRGSTERSPNVPSHERAIGKALAPTRQLFSYQADDGSFFVEDFTNKQALIVLNQAYNHGFQSFWLSEKLFEAFCHSLEKVRGSCPVC